MADNQVNIIITAQNKAKAAFNDLQGDLKGLADSGKATKAEIAAAGAAIVGAVVAIGTTAVTRFADFEAAMSKVKAVTDIAGQEMVEMTELARNLGATTVFTAEEVANAMTELGQAGFTAGEIMKAIPATLDLAAAGGLGIARATEIASSTLRGFQIDTKETTHVVDVMAKTAATSNASIESFGEAMKYFAPTAHAFGVSLEEASATVGILSNAGIQGSLATRALGTSLTRLANPTKKMGEFIEETGFAAFTAEGKFKGMAGMIESLEGAIAGMTDEQRMGTIAALFGAEAIQEINVLLAAGSDELSRYTGQLETSDGAAQKMAKTMLDNVKGAFEQLNGAIDDIWISLGTMLAPTIRFAAEALTMLANAMGAVLKWVQTLPGPIQTFLAVFAGIVTFVVTAAAAWAAFSFALTGFWAAFTAIIGGAAAFIVAWLPLIAILAAIAVAVWLVYEAFQINLFGLKDGVRTFVDFVTLSIMWLKDAWTNNFLGIQDITAAVWGGIVLLFNSAISVLKGIWKIFTGFIMGDWTTMWEGIKLVATTVWDFLSSGWEAWTIVIQRIVEGFAGIISGVWTGITEGMKNMMSAAWEWIKDVFKSGINWILDKLNAVVRGFNSIIGKVPGIGSRMQIPEIPGLKYGGLVPDMPNFAHGGVLQGAAGTDTTMFKGTPGEIILNHAAQAPVASAIKNGSGSTELHIHLDGEYNGVTPEFMEDLAAGLFKYIKPHIPRPAF